MAELIILILLFCNHAVLDKDCCITGRTKNNLVTSNVDLKWAATVYLRAIDKDFMVIKTLAIKN